MSDSPSRHLAAVVFTDLVGYTALMEEDESRALAARARHRAAIQDVFPRHDGRILQFLGDGSLSLFPSSVAAVTAALELQRALASDPPLPIRIGIDEGEVAYDDQGVYGHCVNVASRVESLARAGSVFVSENVLREIENQPAFATMLEGEYELKNVGRPVRVYRVEHAARSLPVELRFFGGASVTAKGSPVTGRGAQRRRLAFLALLASAPHGVLSRDKMVGYLWPDSDPQKARRLLSEALYVIRRSLGDEAVIATGEDLRLNREVVWSDVQAYEAALEARNLTAAIDLYTGHFLDGFYVDGAVEFERWASARRDRYARDFADALRELAQQAEEGSRWVEAVRRWRRLTELDPFDAAVGVRYMEALEAAGHRAEALQFAQRHGELLSDEFDAQPNPEIEALARRLKESPVRTDLPRRSTPSTAVEPPAAAPRSDEDGAAGTGPTAPTAEAAGREGEGLNERSTRLWWRPAPVALLTAALIAALWAAASTRAGQRPGATASIPAIEPVKVAVMPFRGDTEIGGLWTVLSDYLSDVGHVTSNDHVNVVARIGRETRDLLPDSAAVLARELDATHFALGEVGERDGQVTLSFVLYGSDSAQVVHRFHRSVGADESLKLARDAAIELLTVFSAGQMVDQLGAPGTESVPAFREFIRGNRAFLETDYRLAAEHFGRAVEIDPQFAMAYYRLSQALEWDERFAAAANAADAAERLSRSLNAHDASLVRAWRHFLRGEVEEAEALYNGVLESDGEEDVEALYGLAKVQQIYNPLRGHSRQEATVYLDRLFAVSPGFGDALLASMELAAVAGDHERFDSLQARVRMESNLARTWMLSRELGRGPEPSPARLEVALDSLFGDPLGLGYVAGQLTSYWSRPDVADRLVDAFQGRPEARRGNGWPAVALLLSGLLDVAQGRFVEGAAETRQALELNPGWANELLAYYACLPGRGDREEAVREARAALAGWTPDPRADEALNELLMVHQNLHPVLKIYLTGYLEACGGQPDAAGPAIAELERIPLTVGQGAMAAALAGSLRAHQAFARGEPERALQLLDRIRLRPTVHELVASPFFGRPHDRYLRAVIHEGRDETSEALRWYRSVTEMWDFEYLAPGHLGLARVYAARGDSVSARRHYGRAEAYWRSGDPGAFEMLAETAAAIGAPGPSSVAGTSP